MDTRLESPKQQLRGFRNFEPDVPNGSFWRVEEIERDMKAIVCTPRWLSKYARW
jgi:hypothetical protein